MKIGLVGLGRMGSGIADRVLKGGHELMAYNRTAAKTDSVVDMGGEAAATLADFAQLPTPRVVWVMVPAGEAVDEIIFGKGGLTSVLEKDDIVIDGGNSHYTDSVKRAVKLREHGLHMLDIGTSGGLSGQINGYCLMAGGNREAYDHILPVLEVIAQPGGLGHFGDHGSGHYVKMVHNAIEYGMMQSIAEGFALLPKCEYADLDLHQVASVYQHGSIVQSFLVGLIQNIFAESNPLKDIEGFVSENGEARWTVEAAKRHGVELPSVELSLQVRADSQTGKVSDTTKILAALRNQFGGHSMERS